jgi:hypothetical protein
VTMAKFIYNPLRPTYRANLCGVDFGPDEGQVKPGAVVEMDPADERFINWNEHVSGANDGPCFVLVDDAPKVDKPAPKGKPKADKPAATVTPADPAVELT